MTAALPPGVSQEAMDAALSEFRQIVGGERVFSGERLAGYSDPYSLTHQELDALTGDLGQ